MLRSVFFIFHDYQGAQAGPLIPYLGVHPVEFVGGQNAAQSVPVMRLFTVLVNAPAFGRLESEAAQGKVKMVNGFLVQPPLVALQRKDVVSFFGGDFLANSR